uniref:(California timema) hypothetical protein n=1 Tax=Timema californicum TaxID=61474 RepID=A0A7R9J295_TIMCA|nr:unnamed protein product [Timema californicum]
MTGLALKSKDSLVVMKTKKRLSHGYEKVFPRSLVLPSIDTSSNKQLDIMEVQQLDSELEVVSRPSLAIERLLRGRRERHEDAVRDMREAMMSVNGILEKEVRRESDGLLGELEDIDKAKDIALKSVEVPNLEEEAFSHCWEQIKILSNKKKECIKEYRERVVELENSRLDRIKEILKKHYGELREVHHLLPHDLQNFFEHEILRINQLILNNMRCYDDVTSHLTSIGDKKMLEMLNYLDYRKRKGLIRKKDLDNLDSEYVSTTIL